MLRKYIFILSLVALSACKYQTSTKQVEFHPPLTYSSDWQNQQFRNSKGQPSCTISSGYNGLNVAMNRNHNNKIEIAIKSEQDLVPGGLLTINVGKHNYKTADIFTGSEAKKLADDLYKNDKAYIEWTDELILEHRKVRANNILKLNGFVEQYNKCNKFVTKS